MKIKSFSIINLTDAVNMKYDPDTLRRVCHVRNILIASSQIFTDFLTLGCESDDLKSSRHQIVAMFGDQGTSSEK